MSGTVLYYHICTHSDIYAWPDIRYDDTLVRLLRLMRLVMRDACWPDDDVLLPFATDAF